MITIGYLDLSGGVALNDDITIVPTLLRAVMIFFSFLLATIHPANGSISFSTSPKISYSTLIIHSATVHSANECLPIETITVVSYGTFLLQSATVHSTTKFYPTVTLTVVSYSTLPL